MPNNSLNQLAQNAENLNSTYDNAETPSSNDSLGNIAQYLGWGAAIPSITDLTQEGKDIGLEGNMGLFTNYDSDWAGYRRQRNIGADGQDKPCNQWICLTTADFDFLAYRDSTSLYKNGVLNTSANSGQSGSVGCTAGDLVGVTRPVGQGHGVNFDEGFIYLGWAGFAFAHRRDRNSGATCYMVALQDDTDYAITYTGSDGLVTSLTEQASGNISSAYSLTNLGSLLSTRNYFFYANKPVCVYVRLQSGSGVNDSLQLYPMDQDAKYGAFSASGHIFLSANSTQNRAGANVTQQLFTRSSNGGTTTERNASSATPSVYIDISPGQTSGTLYTGPVQKVQGGNGCLVAAEQQGDANGSEMNPFVSKKAFGTIGSVIGGASDYVCCIGESAITIYHRASNGVLKATQTMSGSATYAVYFTRFATSNAEYDIYESTGGTNRFMMYYDSVQDDERVCYMADTTLELSTNSLSIAGPYTNSSEACAEGPSAECFTAYNISTFANGEYIYTDSTCRTELSEGSIWYNCSTNQSFGYTRYPTGITDISDCR